MQSRSLHNPPILGLCAGPVLSISRPPGVYPRAPVMHQKIGLVLSKNTTFTSVLARLHLEYMF